MEVNYKVINLINGLNLVGDVEYTPDSIVIKLPLEVTAKPVNDNEGKLIGEHMVLRPYLIMTDDEEVTIDQFNVLSSFSLSERLHSSYEQMVNTVYNKEISFEGNFLSEEKPKEIEDLSKEEADKLLDQVNNMIDNLNNDGDDTLH